jgi:hypothetical protein
MKLVEVGTAEMTVAEVAKPVEAGTAEMKLVEVGTEVSLETAEMAEKAEMAKEATVVDKEADSEAPHRCTLQNTSKLKAQSASVY